MARLELKSALKSYEIFMNHNRKLNLRSDNESFHISNIRGIFGAIGVANLQK